MLLDQLGRVAPVQELVNYPPESLTHERGIVPSNEHAGVDAGLAL